MTENNEKQAEREAFEAWAVKTHGMHVLHEPDAGSMWSAWQARAALAQQPQGEAVASQSAEPVALTDAKTLALGAMVDAMRWWGAQEDGIPAECKKAFDSAMLALGWSYSHPQDLKVLAAPPAATGAQGLTEDDVWLLASAAENLRSADKTERRVEAAFRIAAKLDELRKRLALAAPAPSDGAQQAEAVAVELRAVAETVAKSGGFWRTCSGCYDTEDGRPTQKYAYSDVFGCALGNGCSDCGGLGAVWDDTDYDAMAEDMEETDDAIAAPAPTAVPHPEYTRGWQDCLEMHVGQKASASPAALTAIREKLARFLECASNEEGCDTGREWFDALTTIGLMVRTQRSPAMWSLTNAGHELLAASPTDQGEDARDA